MTKRELRSLLRQKRAALSPAVRRAAAESLRRVALREGLLRRHQRIGCYLSFEGEMDTFPLLNHALWLGKSCYLPVVPPRSQRKLSFSLLSDRPSWYHNRFGIQEHWAPRQIRARQLDLLFMPLVGFDLQGHRLGMGGGFYDASLSYLRRRATWRNRIWSASPSNARNWTRCRTTRGTCHSTRCSPRSGYTGSTTQQSEIEKTG